MDADADHIYIDDDAGIFSIANDCYSTYGDALTGEENVISAVHAKITAVNKADSAEEFYCLAKRLSASFKTFLQMQ
uniref:Uncharacterized protein n=1 Tax=Peronospora matthiolae TaxID=2874970 RepID=A0AAV1UXR1_9STRA